MRTASKSFTTTALSIAIAGASSIALLAAGQSFNTSLAAGYTQELFAVTQLGDADGFPFILGGVAFAPNGDVWSSECRFSNTVLHRFSTATTLPAVHGTTSLHPEAAIVPTEGGCGLTNHPDGTIYSNSSQGVWKLDASTGAMLAGPLGEPGNALGITADPSNGHLVYVGADCHPSLSMDSTTCTIFDLDPIANVTSVFARVTTVGEGPDLILGTQDDGITLIDGIYFDPTGTFLFTADRSVAFNGVEFQDFNRLTVFARPALLRPLTAAPDETQMVRRAATSDEPDGVAFHATAGFVVTLNESGGTMTRFQFPGGNYTAAPAVSVFASGGFRGDLLNVGVDGCIYATQGRHARPQDLGTRYDDGTATTEDSIVRICAPQGESFTPGAGVEETVDTPNPEPPGSISGFAYADVNRNSVKDPGEPGIPGATVVLTGPAGGSMMTGPDGSYAFPGLAAGAYSVTAPATMIGLALATQSPLPVAVVAGQNSANNNFGYVTGSIAGSAYEDVNRNGTFDANEPGIGGVGIQLSGPATSSATTSNSGGYMFPNLAAGGYSVAAPISAGQFHLFTPSPLSVPLAAGALVPHVDFGYVPVCPAPPSPSKSNFNGTPIAAGNVLWFNSHVKLSGLGSGTTYIFLDSATVQFTSNGIAYTLPVPKAMITVSPTAACASTTFNQAMQRWETIVPLSQASQNVFLAGLAFVVPPGFERGINPVTWTAGSFSTDRASVTATWQWSAAVYTNFTTDYNAVGVKPADGATCQYANSDHAGTPENFKAFVTGGARGGGGSNFTGSWSGTVALKPVCP